MGGAEEASRIRSRAAAMERASKDKTPERPSSGSSGNFDARRRTQRSNSNVFSMFSQQMIQELKEASKKAKDSKKKEKKEKAAAEEPPTEGGEAPAPSEPKRATRATSNVFSMFKQAQIQEFKEAFTMIDQNRDGFICKDDLKEMFQQTGKEPRTEELEEMIKEAPGPLNFTMFLTLFGEKLHGTDPENTLKSAFAMFDEDRKEFLDEEYIKDLLMNTGDPFTKDEIKQTWKEAPIENGKFDYNLMARIIKRGKEEDLMM